MSPRTLRHPALVAGVVLALGAGAAVPAASATTAPSPAIAERSLLVLTPLLTDVLTTVTAAPTTPLTDTAVTTILTEVPDLTSEAVSGVLELLTPAQIAQLAAVADPATVASLFDGLLGTVTALAQDVGGTSPPAPADVETALGQLVALLSGGVPSDPAAQAALVAVLGQVTTLLGLPDVASLPVVSELVVALRTLGDTMPVPLAEAVTAVLDAATGAGAGTGGGTGTPAPSAASNGPTLAALLALLGLGGGTTTSGPAAPRPGAATGTTAAGVARARIVSVKLNAKRTRVTVRVSCPASAPAAGCRVVSSVTVAGRTARVSRRVTIRRGATRTLKAQVPASVAKRVRRSGGRVVVRVGTTGASRGALSRTVRVRRAAR